MRPRGNILIPTVLATAFVIALLAFVERDSDMGQCRVQPQVVQVVYGAAPFTLAVGDQDPVKTKSREASQDFRIGEGEEYATLRDEVFFTTSNVVDLVPDSSQTTFAVGQKVYVFAALRAPRDERVKVTWYSPEGREILPSAYFDVEPNLGAIGFRIFSYRTFRNPGEYRVAVFNSAGRMIGESVFNVK